MDGASILDRFFSFGDKIVGAGTSSSGLTESNIAWLLLIIFLAYLYWSRR